MDKIRFILIVCLLSSAVFLTEARTIKDFFISEPGNVLPLISQRTRMDMIDYFNAGRMADVKNNLGKSSRFNKVTDDYMSIRISGSSTVEMLLMPISKKDTVIITITTVELPAKDSRVAVYDTEWKPVETKRYFKPATMKNFVFIPKGDKTKKETVLAAIDFPIISYTIDADSRTIVARHGLEQYMSEEDFKKIKPYLRDSIPYTRKRHTFTPRN